MKRRFRISVLYLVFVRLQPAWYETLAGYWGPEQPWRTSVHAESAGPRRILAQRRGPVCSRPYPGFLDWESRPRSSSVTQSPNVRVDGAALHGAWAVWRVGDPIPSTYVGCTISLLQSTFNSKCAVERKLLCTMI